MGSASKHQTRPHPNPATSSDAENPNPDDTSAMELDPAPPPPPFTIDDDHQDLLLSKSTFLTRQEVLRRRHRRLKHEIQLYEDFYWGLMEEYRVKHREYYWKYGKSPFEEDGGEEVEKGGGGEGVGEIGGVDEKLGIGIGNLKIRSCGYGGCKAKAMALTDYCHSHILSDARQQLYKACKYTIKSPQTGPVHCGKPILKSTIPSLCAAHLEKARAHATRALKKAGLTVSSVSKLSPKFHALVAESVQQINTKRQRLSYVGGGLAKEECANAGSGLVKVESVNGSNNVVEVTAD